MPQTIIGQDAQADEPDVFLQYHGASHVTGQRLRDFLGVNGGRGEASSRPEYLIRWGSRSGAGYRPSEDVINSQQSIQNCSDKLSSLRQMSDGGIPVPEFTTDRDEIRDTFGYPALGRAENHTRGQDVNLIMQWRDAYLTDGNDYFIEYIPTQYEYRYHVIDGEVVQIHEKRLQSDEDNHAYIRNHETGWVFVEPRSDTPDNQLAIDAVGSLGMDFGAVDIIKTEPELAESGDYEDAYVLEVNSAPSLEETNLEIYGEKFAEMVGLEDYPGMDAVEWDDDDDNSTEEGAESDSGGGSRYETIEATTSGGGSGGGGETSFFQRDEVMERTTDTRQQNVELTISVGNHGDDDDSDESRSRSERFSEALNEALREATGMTRNDE